MCCVVAIDDKLSEILISYHIILCIILHNIKGGKCVNALTHNCKASTFIRYSSVMIRGEIRRWYIEKAISKIYFF